MTNHGIRTVTFKPAQTIQLKVNPNPALNRSVVRFNLSKGGNYTLAMYDMKGTLVKILNTGRTEGSGNLLYDLDATSFANGTYLIKLITSDEVKVQKLMIEHR